MPRRPVTPDYDSATHRVACPFCLRHPQHIIDPACLPCGGTGVLTLGAAALYDFPPEAVALAITTALTEAYTTGEEEALLPAVLTLYTAGVLDLDSTTHEHTTRP